MLDIQMSVDHIGEVAIIKIAGRIDSHTSGSFSNLLNKLIEKKEYKLIVDLKRVDFISSAGWGLITGVLREVRGNGGDIKLAGMSERVEESYEILELGELVETYKDVGNAVQKYIS